MNKLRLFLASAALASGVALLAVPASANDAVRVKITDQDGAITIDQNGAFLTPGTYAIGTIKLWYMIEGSQFPADTPIKEFQMCLKTVAGKPKPATKYPATVDLAQVGNSGVNLTPDPTSVQFLADDVNENEEDCAHPVSVTVTVPAEVANDPDYQIDHTQIVGNLQLSTPAGTHLDTVTTVKVFLTLVHPSATCGINPLHLVSNNDISTNLSDTGISLQYNVSSGNLSQNQAQHVVALVNTCDDPKTVDLNTANNSNFDLQSADAVQTTTSNMEFADIATLLGYDLNTNETFTGMGTTLCLQNVAVPGHQTFVVKEHLALSQDGGFPGTTIYSTLDYWYYDGFTYAAYSAGTGCTGGLSSDVDPNTGEVTVPVNLVDYTGGGAPADQTPTQCADGKDNEAVPDGLIDFPADPQCSSLTDDDETN